MTIVEVLSDNPYGAQLALDQRPEILSVTQLGIRLRVLVPNRYREPLELVVQSLGAAGFHAEARIVSASLEDVFVAVTQENGNMDRAA
jgi:ABC-2 type transport system ATP-binding protein